MRFPIPTEVSGPASMRGGGVPVADQSGQEIAQGVSNLASGIRNVAGSFDAVAGRQRDQENAIDLSRAEAFRTAKFLDIQNAVSRDNNFSDYGKTYQPQVDKALATAAGLIRDPRMRERWLADQEVAKVKMADAWNGRAVQLQDELNFAGMQSAIEDNFKLMSDPSVPREVRDKARSDVIGSLHMGESTGLLTPGKALEFRDKYLKGADQALAANLAELDLLTDPLRVKTGMAIPTEGAAGSILDAQMAVDGGVLSMDPALAASTAKLLGDANFPAGGSKAEIDAFLSDDQKRLDYTEAALAHLSDRYNGDLSAVVIAMDPNGGTVMADRWVASNHSPGALTGKVRDRYESVMSRLVTAQPTKRVPLQTDGYVDLTQIDVGVLKQFEQLQSHLGVALAIKPPANGTLPGSPSITVDVSMLNEDARAKVIQMASAYGFTGIGVGKDTLTLDTGRLRSWGTDGNPESIPAWAKEVTAAHDAGVVEDMPTLYSGVAPEYAALSFDQRMQFFAKAKAALSDRNVNMRASLETISSNAPAAIAATGRYDGDLPTALQFVQAYGADEGIQKFHQFQSAVDVAKTTFGFTGATNDEIEAAVRSATPISSGNNAELEQKRFDIIQRAASAVLDQRAKDPAGYVLNTMPAVQAAFAEAQKDASKMPAALTAMAEGQKELGLDPAPLPKGLVTAAVQAFNDTTLPAAQRLAGVAQWVFATDDLVQQDAIFQQMQTAGLPQGTAGVFYAMRRGDQTAAQNLLTAAMVPADQLAKMPIGITDDAIKNEIVSTVFDDAGIGTIAFGVHTGATDNLMAAGSAADLIFRDAKLLISRGMAPDAVQAVRMATRDYFGDDQVIKGNTRQLDISVPVGLGSIGFGDTRPAANVLVTAPAGANVEQMKSGFANVLPLVRASLRAYMIGDGLPTESGEGNMALTMSVDNYVETALLDGFFTDASGFVAPGQKGYVFMYNDGPVLRSDGKGPLVFSLDDILAASSGLNFSGPPDNRMLNR